MTDEDIAVDAKRAVQLDHSPGPDEAELSWPIHFGTWLQKDEMPDLPESLKTLTISQKLLYVYLSGKGELTWRKSLYAERTGLSERWLTPAFRTLAGAGLASFTDEGAGRVSSDNPGYVTLNVQADQGLGRPRELPKPLIEESITARLIYLYLKRSGLVLSTPGVGDILGLSWLGTYETLKKLKVQGYIKTKGARPLFHKAV